MTKIPTYITDLGRLSDYFDSFFVGYDNLFNSLYNTGQKSIGNNYPPANVVKIDDVNYRIDLAVAGFKKEEITVGVADGVIRITGEKEDNDLHETYIHQKIAYRDFEKEYTLNPEIVVLGAKMEDGILSIDLKHEIPEHKKPKVIEIS